MKATEIFPKSTFNIPAGLKYDTEKLLYKSGLLRSGETLTFYSLGVKILDKIKEVIISRIEAENFKKIHQFKPSVEDIKREIYNEKILPLYFYSLNDFTLYSYEITNNTPKLLKILSEILDYLMQKGIKQNYFSVAESDEKIIYSFSSEKGDFAFLHCPGCSYSYSLNYISYKKEIEPKNLKKNESMKKVYTPGIKTIPELCSFLNISPEKTIKTMIYKVNYNNNKEEYIAALVKGSRNINEEKLKRVLGAIKVALANEEEIINFTNTKMGFAGPIGLDLKVIADKDIIDIQEAVVGANEEDYHLIDVIPEKDIKIDILCDIKENKDGDPCPVCNRPMEIIEGQIVAEFATSKENNITFNSMKIDLFNLFYLISEKNRDSEGLIFTPEFSPVLCYIIPINVKNESILNASKEIYEKLIKYVDIIIDDREESPGVKFKDADLLGIPYKIIIGNKFIKEGKVEIKERKTGKSFEIELNNINIEFFNSL